MGNVDKDKKTDDTRMGTTTRPRIIHNGRDKSGHENDDDDNGVMCDVMTVILFPKILAAIYHEAISAPAAIYHLFDDLASGILERCRLIAKGRTWIQS